MILHMNDKYSIILLWYRYRHKTDFGSYVLLVSHTGAKLGDGLSGPQHPPMILKKNVLIAYIGPFLIA